MCIGGRVPIQRKDGAWYHTSECCYNPYIAKWAGEEGYKSLKEVGVITNEMNTSFDIELINKTLTKLYES
jgi:hypothetical protein